MHAHTPPDMFTIVPPPAAPRASARAAAWVARHRLFFVVVVVPSLLAAAYLYLIAADQFVSEAHFVVRASSATRGSSPGLGQLLGIGEALSPSQTESQALGDYLSSHDAVAVLDRRLDLAAMFRRPAVDIVNRLDGDAAPETLLKFYRRQIDVNYSGDSGITTLVVRAFTPGDAFRIAATLLEVGEDRVNRLNRRAYDNSLAVARGQLADAERELAGVQAQLTRFRQHARDIDPVRSGTAQIELASTLRGQLAAARAALANGLVAVRPDSPQIAPLRARVASLAAQLAQEQGRMTGGARTMATGLGDYEQLQLRQDFAAKRYAAAAAGLETAREQASRQQLFVVRVVEPNRPVKSLYPRRARTLLAIIVGLVLIYAIGWLIAAGVREHAA